MLVWGNAHPLIIFVYAADKVAFTGDTQSSSIWWQQ
jgi:hypothetical protein